MGNHSSKELIISNFQLEKLTSLYTTCHQILERADLPAVKAITLLNKKGIIKNNYTQLISYSIVAFENSKNYVESSFWFNIPPHKGTYTHVVVVFILYRNFRISSSQYQIECGAVLSRKRCCTVHQCYPSAIFGQIQQVSVQRSSQRHPFNVWICFLPACEFYQFAIHHCPLNFWRPIQSFCG